MEEIIKSENSKIEVICGAIIVEGDSFVMVQEGKESCRGKWNIPAGHLEIGEDIFEAALREVKEETNLDVKLEGLVGVYQDVSDEGVNIVKFIFKASKRCGDFKISGDEILDVKWITFDEFMSLSPDKIRVQDLKDMIADYMNRGIYDLELVKIFKL